jgi:acyl-CoA synthetase (AMP-forming)/AMP-acid ligase II
MADRMSTGDTIASILLDAEAEAGNRPGLYAGDRVLTFSEIADLARRLAMHLALHGVTAGDRVALLLPNNVAFVAAHYALALLGAVIVPINPQMGPQQVAVALRKCRARCLIGSGALVEGIVAVEALNTEAVHIIEEIGDGISIRVAGAGDHSPLDHVPPSDMAPAGSADDPALLFFTSGTTGTPKGVMLSHAQVLFGVDAWAGRWSFNDQTISLMAAPFFHVVYNPLVLGAHRRLGASVVVPEPSCRAVTAAIERYRVTALMGTPAFMRQLVSERSAKRHDLSSLDQIIYGAAPTPPSIVRVLGEAFPLAHRFNCYGMTETSSALTCLGEQEVDGREASVGRAHSGVMLRILDAAGHEVPKGHHGEVCAMGPNVISKYFEAPEVDAQRFYGDWLRTGDAGYVDQDGYLYLLDRVDDQINIDGEKFYPHQIEEVLAAHPLVNEAVAIGVAHATKGQVVQAFVVAEPNAEIDIEQLRKQCIARLPACAIPRRITVLTQIPRNPTGKVLRRELAAMVDA